MLNVDSATVTVILSIISFLAGFIDSIAGGGGLLMIPALLFAGIPPQTVLGTNKFAGTSGTIIALINFVRSKKVIWKVVFMGILFSLIGAFLGSKAILIFQNDTVGKIIVFLLPLAMLITLVPKKERVGDEDLPVKGLQIKVSFICFSLGFYDGFFGPGTGSFLILVFYLWLGMDLVKASATAKVFNLASCLSALIVFLIDGKVIISLGIPLAIANIAGNYLGSALAIKRGARIVKAFLIISLVILFISLLIKFYIA
ncbi:TSUP family transporter [Desulfosporosinus sp. OT]|uniref:TSUP family transporter n=1 Tax=Desulfosporosinus sp. OT TaxID=913865 RepID=UPI000223A591|nr:TSUP family transporter [Desulfosporosinus sp. OT]EGW40596.1 hypothetical protein DOT_1475 [Desulfosporosinus sp. OT]